MKNLFAFAVAFLILPGYIYAQLPVIADLKAWYASDSVLLNAGKVSTLYDKSGNSAHASQATTSKQPTLITNQLNGKSVLRFDGTDDGLATSSNLDFTATSGITVFLAYKVTTFDAKTRIIYEQSNDLNSTPNSFAYVLRDVNREGGTARGNVGNSVSIVNITRNSNYLLSTQVFDKSLSSSEVKIYLNSILSSAPNTGQDNNNTNNFATHILNIGSRGNGAGGTQSSQWAGDIAEMIFYARALTVAEQNQVEQYLRMKYAPQIWLGADISQPYGVCPVTLNAGNGFTNIVWSTGATTTSINVTKPGQYTVSGKDIFGYTTTDTILVAMPFTGLNIRDTTLCQGNSVIIQPLFSSPGLYTYLWSTGATTSFINVNTAGSYTVRITDTNNCSVTSDTVKVAIDAFPQLRLFGNDTTLCRFSNLSVKPSVKPFITAITWSTGDNTPDIIISTPGNTIATATNSAGCISKDTIAVTFSGTAPASQFTVGPGCSKSPIIFTNQSTSQLPDSIVRSHWSFGDGDTSNQVNPLHTFASEGSYNVSLTTYTKGGCQGSITKQVTIKPSPTVNFDNLPGCINNAYAFTDKSIAGSNDTLTSWYWDFGNSSSSTQQNTSYTYAVANTYNVVLQVTSVKGCIASITKPVVIVASAPTATAFTLLRPLNGFTTTNNILTFSWNQSNNAIKYRLVIAADPGLASVISSSIYTGTIGTAALSVNSATYYWRVMAFNSCADSIASPVYTFTVFSPASLSCLKFRADGTSAHVSGNTVTQWADSSGNNLLAVPPTNNARPTLVTNTQLNNNKVLRFNGTNNGLRTTTNMDFAGTPGITCFMVYRNTSYDGATKAIYEHSDDLNTNLQSFGYFLRDVNREGITIKGDAGNSANTIAIVNPARDTNFIISTQLMDKLLTINEAKIYLNGQLASSSTANQDHNTNFASFPLNIGARGNASGLFWRGDIAEMLLYCDALDSAKRVMVESYLRYKYAPQVFLGPDLVVPYGVCDTSLTIPSIFKNIRWSTGDSTATIRVKKAGVYWVTALDILGYTTSDTMVVDFPYKGSNVGTTVTVCLGDSVRIQQQLEPANAYAFLWQNGATGNFIYASMPGNYYATITDTNQCVLHTDTIRVTIDSFKLYQVLADTTVCIGNQITPLQGKYRSLLYIWHTGSTDSAITVTGAGTYAITVTDIHSCTSSSSAVVSVKGTAPVADFNILNLCLGDTTLFTDITVATPPDRISSWNWTFGDSDTSSLQNPSHYYTALGRYDVHLTLVTDSGCTGEKTKSLRVSPSPQADFSYPSVICAGTTSPFFDNSTILLTDTISTWLWTFDNKDLFTTPNLVYSFPNPGAVPVKLLVTSKGGCSDSATGIIEVFAPLVADYKFSNVCLGDSTVFTDITQSFSVVNWQWNFDDGSFFSSLPSPKHKYMATGTYNVKLTIENAIGCIDTVTKAVRVVKKPTAVFNNLIACENTFYTPLDSSLTPDEPLNRWRWNINGTIYNTPAPSYFFADTGLYPAALTITSQSGCMDSTKRTVRVVPNPAASFTLAPLYGEAPLDVTFNNTSAGTVSSLWNFGDGSTSTDEDPLHTYIQNDTFDITLQVASAFGCLDSASNTLIVSRTELDLSVDEVRTTSVPQPDGSTLVTIVAQLSNLGTRVITHAKLYAILGTGGVISEDWNGLLPSGSRMEYTFTANFVIGPANNSSYVCVEGVSANNGETEMRTDNNLQCVSLNGTIQLVGPAPNPAYEYAYLGIILPKAGQVTVDVSDVLGRFIVHNEVLDLPQGRSDFIIPVTSMRAAEYIVRVQYNDDIYLRRLVVK